MKVVVVCEGRTEAALRNGLRHFVHRHAVATRRIGLTTRSLNGPTLRKKLGRVVRNLFEQEDVAGVIALTDVHPTYKTAAEAKDALRRSAGDESKRTTFKPHAAQFEVEAWILPFWDEIARYLRVNAASPGADPERVNNQKPPSHHLKELYRRAKSRFDKVSDGPRWLTSDRLVIAAQSCPELRYLLNSLLEFARASTPH